MALVSRHTYQVLTKRAARMADLLGGELSRFAALPNVWWGVGVENRQHGLPRIEYLRRVPAGGARFLSCAPPLEDLGPIDLTGIGWVIAGSESGPGARPCDDDWVRSLGDQSVRAGVPFFYKQAIVTGKKVSLPLLDGKSWDEMPTTSAVQWEPAARAAGSAVGCPGSRKVSRRRHCGAEPAGNWAAEVVSLTAASPGRRWGQAFSNRPRRGGRSAGSEPGQSPWRRRLGATGRWPGSRS